MKVADSKRVRNKASFPSFCTMEFGKMSIDHLLCVNYKIISFMEFLWVNKIRLKTMRKFKQTAAIQCGHQSERDWLQLLDEMRTKTLQMQKNAT